MEATLERPAVDVIEGHDRDRAVAGRIGAMLPVSAEPGAFALLIGPDQERIPLPVSVYRALRDAVDILSRGDAIVIGSVHQKLTTTDAASLLGVSRQYLVRLIDRGDLRHELVGRHRRLLLSDVLEYKERRATQRRKTLEKLSTLDVELGAYD